MLEPSATLDRIEKKIDDLKAEIGKQERIEKKIDGLKAEDTARNTNIPQVIQECMKKVEDNKKDEDKRKCNVSCHQPGGVTGQSVYGKNGREHCNFHRDC